MAVLAVDCGGTRVKAAAVSGGVLGALRSLDVSGADADAALEAVVSVGREVTSETPCALVGLCVPGLVDERGVVVALPGKFPGLVGRNLPELLRSALDLDAVVCNDAVAYGLGEASAGAGAGADPVVVVTIGTGVGVCVVAGGRPVGRGPCGGGILGGQIPISDTQAGPVDTNGRPDSIEAFCRADRIVRETGCDTVPAAYGAYEAGDPAAREGIASYRSHLARAIVALAHAHAPEVVVLGGGPVRPGAPILEGLQEAVDSRTWPGYSVQVRPAALGDGAALLGLAHLAVGTG